MNTLAGIWHARQLLWALTRREIHARHAGTALGLLWGYVQPLLTVAAYYLVFDQVFQMRMTPKADAHTTLGAGTYLIVGSLPWMAFCDGVVRGMNSLLDAAGMLQKNPLPPALFPLRTVLASALVHAPLMVVLALSYWPHHQGRAALLALPLLVVLQWVLCGTLAYALAILAAAVRDTTQVVAFLLSVGIFLSPVLFQMSQFPADWQWALWINPMTGLVLGYQDILLHGLWPESGTWWATLTWLTSSLALLCLLVTRSRDVLVDWL